MKMLQEEGQLTWDNSYRGGGNICFYPHEEIVRFVNRYVRKRDGIDAFHNIMDLTEDDWNHFKSLDLGCGIGRHVKFLDEFGLNPYGIDLSDTAVTIGKDWFRSLGRDDLAQKLAVGSVTELPYDDETFWICVSCGTLDSMQREIAQKGMEEAFRVIKKNGLMYLDLIMGLQDKDGDEIVLSGYEKDTIQSYFTCDSIREFLGERAEIIRFEIITHSDEQKNITGRRAHLIIQKK